MPTPIRPADLGSAQPQTIDHFMGQRNVRERVKVSLEAAWADGLRFQHTLMVGPPGTGKTLAANIIAREMGSQMREVLAQSLTGPGELAAALLDADDRDCVFIDEIHELPASNQVLLYRAMEEGKLFLPSPSSNRPPRVLPLANITVLGATTDEWCLQKPLVDRFKLILRFQTYSIEELAELLKQRVHALHWPVDEPVFMLVAQRSKGTPRLALRLLEACWRTARSQGDSEITVNHLDRTCQLEEIDPIGLDALEQKLIRILDEAAGPVRLNVLASRLDVPARTCQTLERFLVNEGLITKDSDGRQLTDKGRQHVRGGHRP